MDAPQIQYARTEDGVNIAYWIMGEGGPPLVHLPLNLWASDIQREAQFEPYQIWFDALRQDRASVRYDNRGCGVSDHDVEDFSLEALVPDLAAVVDAVAGAVGSEQVALFAGIHAGPVVVAYAAAYPERVSELVLWCTRLGPSDLEASVPWRAIAAMREVDAAFADDAMMRLGIGVGEDARDLVRFIADRQVDRARAPLGVAAEVLDASDRAAPVRARTLVVWPSDAALFPLSMARQIATAIPNSTLAVIQGDSQSPVLSQAIAVAAEIRAFLGPGRGKQEARQHGFRTILFTDVVSSTELTDRLGDAKARAVLREHERLTREALAAHGGTESKTMGDGFMASFTSASGALDAAIAMQQAITDHYADSETPIRIRVGINAGEPIVEEEDLYGASVIRTARVMGQAQGGELLVNNVVRELVEGKEYLFSDRGDAVLKGFDEAVRLFKVRWHDAD